MYTANYKIKLRIPQNCRGHSKWETTKWLEVSGFTENTNVME